MAINVDFETIPSVDVLLESINYADEFERQFFDLPGTPCHVYVDYDEISVPPERSHIEEGASENDPRNLMFDLCSNNWEDEILTSDFDGKYFFAGLEGTEDSEEIAVLFEFINRVRKCFGFEPILALTPKQ